MFSVQRKSKDKLKKKKQSAGGKPTWEELAAENPKLKAFMEERKKRHIRIDDLHETDFWVCLVFQSEQQKKEFLKQVNVPKVYGSFVDGEEFAASVGKPVTPSTLKPHETIVQKRLAEMVIASERERLLGRQSGFG